MTEFSIYKGIGLDAARFAAAAFMDAEETPDEPGTTSVLLTSDPGEGWERLDIAEDRVTGLATSKDGPLAVSERRRIYGFDEPTPVSDLSDIVPYRLSCVTSGPGGDVTVVGDNGYFLTGRPSIGFGKLTEAFEQGTLSHDVTPDALEAWMNNARLSYNCALLSDGSLALAQFGGLAHLGDDELSLYAGGVEPVDLWPMPDGTAVAVGHSPRVVIYRFRPGAGLEPIFDAPTEARQAACIAVHDGVVYVGASDPRGAGVFRLDSSGLHRVSLPDDQNDLPVFDVDSIDGTLWVFRAKDVLRLSPAGWDRLTPEGDL